MIKTTISDKIRELVKEHTYLNADDLYTCLREENLNVQKNVIKQTTYRLMKTDEIYNAGRGWYSSIATEFKLDRDPVNDIVEHVQKQFPFISFCVWSTEQLASYYHHVPSLFLHFIYTERDVQEAVADEMTNYIQPTYANPRKPDMPHVKLENQTCVIRPSITQQPCDDNYARVEKALVDLQVEKEEFYLMDDHEYMRLFKNVAGEHRINISALLAYASRRNRREEFEELVSRIQQKNESEPGAHS